MCTHVSFILVKLRAHLCDFVAYKPWFGFHESMVLSTCSEYIEELILLNTTRTITIARNIADMIADECHAL